ncbi:MAG: hypothetical protein QG597_2779, partial [Actinomycetota bacterium]|nr:hypothetical protein [Actinomycetota bacterium]
DPMRAQATATAKAVQNSVAPLRSGDFVLDTSTFNVYRIAGGAPVYVSSWAPFGGPKPLRLLTSQQIAALPRFPTDGTFLLAAGSGAVYRVAGGAPVYVSSWAPFGGVRPTVVVDGAVIDRAGSGGVFDHLRYRPADGTGLLAEPGRRIYRIVRGAPISQGILAPGVVAGGLLVVNQDVVSKAGTGGRFNHLAAPPIPTPTPTATATRTPTPSPTATRTPTPSPTPTPTPSEATTSTPSARPRVATSPTGSDSSDGSPSSLASAGVGPQQGGTSPEISRVPPDSEPLGE